MSLNTFLVGVREGGKPNGFRLTADHPPNSTEIENRAQRLDLWLTPKTVEGFDADDFTFLTSTTAQPPLPLP